MDTNCLIVAKATRACVRGEYAGKEDKSPNQASIDKQHYDIGLYWIQNEGQGTQLEGIQRINVNGAVGMAKVAHRTDQSDQEISARSNPTTGTRTDQDLND